MFSLYAHTGRLADGFDKILRLTHASTKVVEKYIDKNQPQDKELSVWKLGMCIWQLQNIVKLNPTIVPIAEAVHRQEQ